MNDELNQHVMTEAEASRITEDIRHTAKSFTEYRARLMDAVDKAKAGNAHLALGYASWTAYLSEVLGEEPMRLARAERQDMVRMLSDEGMSTRAIAPIVGSSFKTVANDRGAGVQNYTPETAPVNVNTETGEIRSDFQSSTAQAEREVVAQAQAVQGMDGKTYTRPEPSTPRAEATTTQFASAIADMNRVLDKFHRIASSDNFNRNKNQVAALHGNDLDRAISELQNLAESLH